MEEGCLPLRTSHGERDMLTNRASGSINELHATPPLTQLRMHHQPPRIDTDKANWTERSQLPLCQTILVRGARYRDGYHSFAISPLVYTLSQLRLHVTVRLDG